MSNIVIGTAGHVDHGKTTLIKALTGIETDTTKEEKKRGMSINLGFAYLDLPNNQRVGIVDVPGHEKFIKNMVAGLPGINLVLLVIDAGESVMPQTREHFDILSLLGIQDFLIVLTKVDTVDEEIKELTIEDIREQFSETVLSDCEIIETDAVSGKGLPYLLTRIQEKIEQIENTSENGEARLNIDRVFNIKGFGPVVTGTLLDGSISEGDSLTLYPAKKKVRVRNIQIHEQKVKKAESRHRTAINLSNVTMEELHRGDVLSISNSLEASWMVDTKIRCLGNSVNSIDLWDRVRILIGSKEVIARTVPLGKEMIQPGEEGFLQLRLEEQIFVENRDHFILRTYSPMRTIAGGKILDTQPPKHRRYKSEILESLQAKENGELKDIIADHLMIGTQSFFSKRELLNYCKVSRKQLDEELHALIATKVIKEVTSMYAHQLIYNNLKKQVLQLLTDYHKNFPLRQGMSIEELRSRLRNSLFEKEIPFLIKILLKDHYIKENNNFFAIFSFSVQFNTNQLRVKEKIETALNRSMYTPVDKETLISLDNAASEVLPALIGDTVISLTYKYFISKYAKEEAIQKTHSFILKEGKMTLADFRDMTSSSRKSSMLILEYLDQLKITQRFENYRLLGTYWKKADV